MLPPVLAVEILGQGFFAAKKTFTTFDALQRLTEHGAATCAVLFQIKT